MRPPRFVRPLPEAERAALREGLRAPEAFTRRRCPIRLPSDRGERPSQIAAALGCSSQAARDTLRAFAAEGLARRRPKSTRPKALHAAWPKQRDEDRRALPHQSPATSASPPA